MTRKANGNDLRGRFREIVSDPLNLLIERTIDAGSVVDGLVELHNGHRVPVSGADSYYETFADILVINRGVHEPLEEFVFQEMLRVLPAAPMMIELGAYWGHYSMWLKKVRPHGKVWLIEPDAHHLDVGRANFDRHGYEGEFIHAGVRGRKGFELDRFMETHALQRLHVLHADVQGAELDMLDGAAATLGRSAVDYMFVSTHSQEGHLAVRETLRRHGYRIEVSSDVDDQTTAFDGLVFASARPARRVFTAFRPLGRLEICSSRPRALVDYLLEVGPPVIPIAR
jgi:hypothetical protein